MLKLQRKNAETAQGMVEFALVLPILLMVIMGVFAFGHLFFVYSTLVSASREAARFGSAVGVTDSGKPRYKACDEIIGAAVNIGKFAGVSASNVTITFDDGPDDTNAADNGTCPAGGTGPEVDLGDRIKVDINVMYTPIVPLVPIPSFNLNGQTNRTIVKDLAVGDSPDAEDPCLTQTKLNISKVVPDKLVGANVGDTITFTVSVETVNAAAGYTTTKGKVKIESAAFAEPLSCNISVPVPAPGSIGCGGEITTEGTHNFTVTFVPDADQTCHLPSPPITIDNYKVLPVSTAMTLDAIPASGGVMEGDDATFYVTVPSGQYPAGGGGTVTVSDTALAFGCTFTLDANGKGNCTFKQTVAGDRVIQATYTTPSGTTLTATLDPYKVKPVVSEPTITTIISDAPDPSEPGNPVTITIKVAPSAVGSVSTPTGSVTVALVPSGTVICGPLPLTNGSASCTYTFSTEGEYSLRATYSPNTVAFLSSTSADEPHKVESALICPTASNWQWSPNANNPTAFKVNITNNSPDVMTLSTLIVTFEEAGSNSPKLKAITKTSTTLFSTEVSISPVTIDTDTGNTTHDFISGADLSIPNNSTRTFTFSFVNKLNAGKHSVYFEFSNGCKLTVERSK